MTLCLKTTWTAKPSVGGNEVIEHERA
jgi:hypothetical protein